MTPRPKISHCPFCGSPLVLAGISTVRPRRALVNEPPLPRALYAHVECQSCLAQVYRCLIDPKKTEIETAIRGLINHWNTRKTPADYLHDQATHRSQ